MFYSFLSEKYQLIEQVGQGAFGQSYLAKENETNKLVVIKVIEDDRIWQNIKNGEKLLCRVNNEYIMRIYRIEEFGAFKCIIQEYVTGINLNQYIPNNDLTLEHFLNISYGVLKAIEYLDTLNLSHKDIKPSNIIYDKDNKIPKLIDLDYMSILALYNQNYVGTIKYSSPEQIIDNGASSKADIYSLGMVICFMILGDILFDVDLKKKAFITKKKVENALKNIPNLNRDIINKIVNLVGGLLEYSPINRLTPSKAIQQIEEIIKTCDEKKQGSVVIHKHMSDCTYISDDLTFFISAAETAAIYNGYNNGRSYGSSNNQKIHTYFRENSKQLSINNNIEENKNIYRKQLLKEYENILSQAKISFGLWVFSFIMCFIVIFVSVFLIINKNYIEGIITVVLDGAVVAIQKIFNIREDHYRMLMEQKIKHLETGDYLDYAFEKVEKLDNPEDKNREVLELIKTIRAHANKHEETE